MWDFSCENHALQGRNIYSPNTGLIKQIEQSPSDLFVQGPLCTFRVYKESAETLPKRELSDEVREVSQLHFPSTTHRIIKIKMVLKQPPPNFHAPIPDNSPLNRLFMIILIEWLIIH